MATLTTIQGDDAIEAFDAFARDHPRLANHIQELGNVLLGNAVGIRDGSNGASKTYDLSFVNHRHAFASLTATLGKHDSPRKGRLSVQVRYQGGADLQIFKLKSRSSEISSGWHSAQIAPDGDTAPLVNELATALADTS